MKTAADIRSIAIAGAGVMGSGIALTAALAGYRVILFDIHEGTLAKAKAYIEKFLAGSVEKGKMTADKQAEILAAITYTGNQADVVADIVLEAILENLELKHKLMRELEAQNAADCIMASNTSTLPITRIAAGLSRPAQVVGMHFFNPAPLMKLVEVIPGEMTDPQVTEVTKAVSEKMGKTVAICRDEPGFIVNRVARHFYVEGMRVLEENVAGFEQIDRIMESRGFKMGPFKLMDLIGVDTNHEVTKSLYNAFFQDEKFRPSRIQQKKVDAGHYGRKSGRGFYKYEF